MKLKYFITILLLICFFSNLKAQDYKRTAWWYFGYGAGLHFTDTGVFSDTNSNLSTIEGCATLSDTNGNLLLYTDGKKVWNKKHKEIFNGYGLMGNASTAQNSIIIPIGNNDSLFYIFTLGYDTSSANELRFNLIDLTWKGSGIVLEKNIFLLGNLTEKMTVTKHANGIDYWLMVQEQHSSKIHFFHIKNKKVIECPITNFIGSSNYNGSANAKFSPDATKLAISNLLFSSASIELYKFDNLHAIINEKLLINNVSTSIYNVEFSSNSKFLYASEFQKDVSKFSLIDYELNKIKNSKEILYTVNNGQIQGIQLGSDKNIYYSNNNLKYIGAIINSDSQLNTYFDTNYVDLSPRKASYGLLNFITSYFNRPKIDFSYIQNCDNKTIKFNEKYDTINYSIKWNIFKDSNLIQTYSSSSPSHTFIDTGLYDVELIINSDTVKKQLLIEPKIFKDSIFVSCNKDSFSIHIPDNFRCINWSNGSEQKDTLIKQEGIYKVSAYNIQGCYITDSLIVKFSNITKPNIVQNNDTLFTDSISYKYNWYENNEKLTINNYQIIINDTGYYFVEIENDLGCKNQSEIIKIKCNINKPNILQSNDTLFTDSTSTKYTWFKNNSPIANSQQPKLYISDTGEYYVEIENEFGCKNQSEIIEIKCNHIITNIQRKGLEDSLFTNSSALKYQWYMNGTPILYSNLSKIKITQKGNYSLETEDSFSCLNTSKIFPVTTLDISNILKENIKIYPNPIENILNIEANENSKLEITIYDISGKTIKDKKIYVGRATINLEGFADGIYLININNNYYKIIKN